MLSRISLIWMRILSTAEWHSGTILVMGVLGSLLQALSHAGWSPRMCVVMLERSSLRRQSSPNVSFKHIAKDEREVLLLRGDSGRGALAVVLVGVIKLSFVVDFYYK